MSFLRWISGTLLSAIVLALVLWVYNWAFTSFASIATSMHWLVYASIWIVVGIAVVAFLAAAMAVPFMWIININKVNSFRVMVSVMIVVAFMFYGVAHFFKFLQLPWEAYPYITLNRILYTGLSLSMCYMGLLVWED